MIKINLFAIIFGVVFGVNISPNFPDNIIDHYLDVLNNRGQFNGVLLISDKNGIQYNRSFGFADFNNKTPLTTASTFRLASVSKQFTAFAIMLLDHQNHLDIDQDIRDFLPNLPYNDITVRNLLQHTSGLPDYMELIEKEWASNSYPKNDDILLLLENVKPKMEFYPGSNWEYSNTGYVLLALIIEIVSGYNFEEFLERKIFDPLKMESTLVFTKKNRLRIEKRVTGFRFGGVKIFDDHKLNFIKGDGGIYSTTTDLYKWHRALINGTLLPSNEIEIAYKPAALSNGKSVNYGYGWEIEDNQHHQIVYHSGGWLGFSNFIYRNLTEELLIVLFTNDGSPYRSEVFSGITDILNGNNPKIPKLDAFDEIGRKILNDPTSNPKLLLDNYYRDKLKYSIIPDHSIDLIWQLYEMNEIELLDHIIELSFSVNRNIPENLFSLGLTAKLLGFYSNAEVILNKVLILQPENSEARKLLDSLQIIRGEQS